MARCALLAIPQRPRTCSSSPAVPRSLRLLGWADFLQQKEHAPWTPRLSRHVCQGRAENHRALVKCLKPLQLDPALGAHGTSGRKKQPWKPPIPVLPTGWSNWGVKWFTASPYPLPSSSSSSKQALHASSYESAKQAGQQAEVSAQTQCHQPCAGTCSAGGGPYSARGDTGAMRPRQGAPAALALLPPQPLLSPLSCGVTVWDLYGDFGNDAKSHQLNYEAETANCCSRKNQARQAQGKQQGEM